MRNSAIARIIIYSVLILLMVALLGAALSLHMGARGLARFFDGDDFEDILDLADDEDAEDDREADHEKAYYMEAEQGKVISILPKDVQEIEIQWLSGNLNVETGDVEDIQLQETVSDHPMLYSLRNGKLLIKFSEKIGKKLRFGFGDTLESKDLTITVPESWTGRELEVQSVSADVEVKNLILEEIKYQGVSGECRVVDCRLGELKAETVSGDVEVTGEIRELDCESVSADCDLTVTNVPEEISLEGVSGNLNLTLPAEAGFTVELEGLSKDLDTDFPVTSKNGKFIAGDGSCSIEIEGVSGRARIRKAA